MAAMIYSIFKWRSNLLASGAANSAGQFVALVTVLDLIKLNSSEER